MIKIPLVTVPSYPASTLAKVLRAVVELFASVEPSTKVYVGERYLHQEGAPRRIVLVPDGGTIGAVLAMGEGAAASVAQGCTAYLWGAETADDLARYDDADSLLDRFVNALGRLAPGRILPNEAPLEREDATNVETYGEEYRLRFSYKRQVPKDPDVWNYAIPAPSDPVLSPPPFSAPPGTPASTVEIVLSTVPKE